MNRSLACVVVVLACTGGSLAKDLRPEVARALGCYEIVLGKWDPELPLGADQAFLEPAKVIELTSKLYLKPGVADDWLAVRFVSGTNPNIYDSAYWEALKDNYVAVTFTNGFSGVGIVVTFDKAEMRGTAGTFWDFPREHQSAPATLKRVKCGEKRSNNRLKPTDPRVTPLAEGRKRRATRPTA